MVDARGRDATTRDSTAMDVRRSAEAGKRDAGDARVPDATDAGRGADARSADATDARGADARQGDATDARQGDATDARRGDTTDARQGDATDARQGDATPDATDAATCPTLAALAVSPLTLYPPFSPDIHDYYVRCAAGANALTVTIAAPDGGSASIIEPTPSAPAAQQTVMFSLTENQAVVSGVAVDAGSACQYWVRCLPPDFPELQITPHPEAGTPPPGYYLLGDTYVSSGEHGYAMVLDVHGVPVWYNRSKNGAGTKTIQLFDPNTIAYVPIAGYTFTDYEGSWEIHTLNPVGVQYLATVGMPVDMHELRRLPNGDYLVFGDPIVPHVNLTGIGMYGADEDILDCAIQELTPTGELVWQWLAYSDGHIDPQLESTFCITEPANGVSPLNPDGGTRYPVDVFHCNSIDWDGDGNLLVSARDMDAIFLISNPAGTGPTAGKILWKMGPPAEIDGMAAGRPYSLDGARYITVTDDPLTGFFRQHHARFTDGGISLFDDRTLAPTPGPDRGIVLSYDTDAGTASVVWQYSGTRTTVGMGSMTVLADGSHVIGWGDVTGGALTFTEVDPNGNDLLDFAFPETNTGDSSYRATKVPASAVDLQALRTSIGPWSSSTGIPADAGHD